MAGTKIRPGDGSRQRRAWTVDLKHAWLFAFRQIWDGACEMVSCRSQSLRAQQAETGSVSIMSIAVRIPQALRPECHGASVLQLQVPTVRAALQQLASEHPSLYRSVCDETGAVRRHINLFVNETLVRDRERFDTALEPGDELFIMTAVSGG